MQGLKVGVIGLGTWGQNHIEIYQAHPFASVSAICDMNEALTNQVGDKYGISQRYQDYKEMLEKAEIDAVAIVTPDFSHCEITVAAANKKKHILIEKPLATTAEEVKTMIDAIEKNGVRAMVDLHNRFSPPFHAAHQSIEQGRLGDTYSGYFRLNDIKWVATDFLPWAAKSSILWFLGSHSLDTLRWLFKDEVKRVYSVSRAGVLKDLGINTTDVYMTTLEFSRGAVVQMENGWITPNGNPCVNDIKCNIMGTKGMISIDASNHNLIQEYTDTQMTVPDVLVQNSIFGQPKGFAFESIRSFVDCIISGKEFPVTLYDAGNTTLTILAIMESAQNREPVEVKDLYSVEWK